MEPFCFVLAKPINIKDGQAHIPQGPELLISFDLNQIESMTQKVF
jgi:hypothetical protein